MRKCEYQTSSRLACCFSLHVYLIDVLPWDSKSVFIMFWQSSPWIMLSFTFALILTIKNSTHRAQTKCPRSVYCKCRFERLGNAQLLTRLSRRGNEREAAREAPLHYCAGEWRRTPWTIFGVDPLDLLSALVMVLSLKGGSDVWEIDGIRLGIWRTIRTVPWLFYFSPCSILYNYF